MQKESLSRKKESRFGLTNNIRILNLNYVGLGKKLTTLRLKSS
jgi:hypothetical protein